MCGDKRVKESKLERLKCDGCEEWEDECKCPKEQETEEGEESECDGCDGCDDEEECTAEEQIEVNVKESLLRMMETIRDAIDIFIEEIED